MAGTETTLSFHKSLYLPDAVRAAVEVYGDYVETVDVEEDEVAIIVTLRGFDPGYGDVLGDSFGNHALFETVVRARETLAGVPI